MKLSSLLLAVAALALASAAVYFAQRPAAPAAADARVGQPLADRAVLERAGRLRLADQGRTVTLVRQPDDSWRVAEYFAFPADFSKLTAFVAGLTEARVQRLVTRSPDRIARLEFKDSRVEVLDAAGQAQWTLVLGKNAETGGGRFVRFGAEDKAYLATGAPWLDVEPKNWADSQILHLPPEQISRIEIALPDGGPVTMTRAKPDAEWSGAPSPAGQRVNAGKVAAVLGALGTVRFSDTVEPADPAVAAAHAHERVFRLTTFAGQTCTVTLGRKPEEKKLKAPAADKKPVDATPAAPEFDTVPAGPVFVTITSSDAAAPVNALMKKRAFQVADYLFTGLPQKPEELFEPVPPAPAAAKTEPGK